MTTSSVAADELTRCVIQQIIAIVGATATGKSASGVALAEAARR
jgi:hypothetical protein